MGARAVFALLLAGSTVLAVGCSNTTEEEETEASQDEIRKPSVEITEAGDGNTFPFTAGQEIKLSLPSNPTTGLTWQVTVSGLGYPTPKNGRYEADPGGRGGGKQRFVWKPASRVFLTPDRSYLVKLELRRSFEDLEAPPADTFEFTVIEIGGGAPTTRQPGTPKEPPRRPSQDGWGLGREAG